MISFLVYSHFLLIGLCFLSLQDGPKSSTALQTQGKLEEEALKISENLKIGIVLLEKREPEEELTHNTHYSSLTTLLNYNYAQRHKYGFHQYRTHFDLDAVKRKFNITSGEVKMKNSTQKGSMGGGHFTAFHPELHRFRGGSWPRVLQMWHACHTLGSTYDLIMFMESEACITSVNGKWTVPQMIETWQTSKNVSWGQRDLTKTAMMLFPSASATLSSLSSSTALPQLGVVILRPKLALPLLKEWWDFDEPEYNFDLDNGFEQGLLNQVIQNEKNSHSTLKQFVSLISEYQFPPAHTTAFEWCHLMGWLCHLNSKWSDVRGKVFRKMLGIEVTEKEGKPTLPPLHLMIGFSSSMKVIKPLNVTILDLLAAAEAIASYSSSNNTSNVARSPSHPPLTSTMSPTSLKGDANRKVANKTAEGWKYTLWRARNLIESKLKREDSVLAHFSAAEQYLNGYWITKYGVDVNLPALIHNRVGSWAEAGNYLGIYFENIACAHLTGLHYLAVSTYWHAHGDVHGPAQYTSMNATAKFDDFIKMLPDMIVSNSTSLPRTKQEAIDRVHTFCPCYLFCWSHEEAAWPLAVNYIIPIIRSALEGFMRKNPYDEVAAIRQQRLISNATNLTALPLIPNVTIHYRCSDVLRNPDYGFLPYHAFDKIITSSLPSSSSPKFTSASTFFIYIISDHPDRGADKEECRVLLNGLKDHISSLKIHPKAQVIIKRGDSILQDMARIAFSKVTICSGSTFCLWPALASTGRVYMPLNPPVAGLRGALLDPNSFKWILDCTILHFTNESMQEIMRKMKAPCVPVPQSEVDDINNMRKMALEKKRQYEHHRRRRRNL